MRIIIFIKGAECSPRAIRVPGYKFVKLPEKMKEKNIFDAEDQSEVYNAGLREGWNLCLEELEKAPT